jgi:hypothetical protein
MTPALKISLMRVELAITPKEEAEVAMKRIEIGGPNQ